MLSAIPAIALLIVSSLIPMRIQRELPEADFYIPIAWVYMHFWGWLAVTAGAMVITRIIQSIQATATEQHRERLGAAAIWLMVAVGSYLLFDRWGSGATIFRGVIPMSYTVGIAILLLLGIGAVSMVLAGRATASRGYAKAVVTHFMLLAGSVVFGLPFAWLLITSFKEDKDMATADGIVWVPKVTQTVPYLDPNQPQFEGTFQGQTVVGTKIEENPDGTIKLDILRPASLRGLTFDARQEDLKPAPRDVNLVDGELQGKPVVGRVIQDLPNGDKVVEVLQPNTLAGQTYTASPKAVEDVRKVAIRWKNYTEALEFLPPETQMGLVYLRNTLFLVVMSVIGTLLSCSIVAYAFSRLRFPGKNALFMLLLSTMMLPGAVTLLPTFLIFRQLGWIDTLYPLWVPAFFASAFNVFLLRQFFMTIPMELEDAAKIDGCSYLKTFWTVMLPQIKPALAVIAIWTFMGAWNNFMGPLIYINSPENMPIAYAVQLFQGDRAGEPGLMMAFATMAMLPVLLLFFFAQRYFIEGVTLSGLGGR
jgi:multiple sugar transport system permease protein